MNKTESTRDFISRYGLDRPVYRGFRCLFGTFLQDDDFRFLSEDDATAMKSDWQAVGKDMRQAISMYKSQNSL